MITVPALLGIVILASAAVAMSLRNLIHSVLLLIACWFGIGAFYLWAGAEFVAFAQILVYVGAVSMIVLFAVLLTKRSRAEADAAPSGISGSVATALLAGGLVFGVLAAAVFAVGPTGGRAARPPVGPTGATPLTVHKIGMLLMGPQLGALLVIGALLTVALLGAVVLAASGRGHGRDAAP